MQPSRTNSPAANGFTAKEAKLLELETALARRKGFWQGMLVSLLLMASLAGTGALYVWTHPLQVLEWAAGYFLLDAAREVFASFPDAYMTLNRDHALAVLDEFTNAVAADKVSRAEFSQLGQTIFSALKDKQLTYQAVNGFLDIMHQASAEY